MMKKRIVVVDDEIHFAKLVGKFLQHEGFDVTAFKQADGAIDAVEKRRPHMVITDVVMPGMSGLVFAQRINRMSFRDDDGKSYSPKVIVVSGLNTSQNQSNAKTAGAVAFMPKPLNLTDLLIEVKRHLCEKRNKTHQWDYISPFN